jgi:hypothetical protein
MFQQGIDRVRQQAAGRLVPGDEKRVDLIADINVVELLAGGPVDPRQHCREHVLLAFGRGRRGAAASHDVVDHAIEKGDVVSHIALPPTHRHAFERQAARHHHRFERAH